MTEKRVKIEQNAELVRVVKHRMKVIKAIRAFFDDQDFTELIVPILNAGVPAELTIYPFSTQWWRKMDEKARTLYLPVSPERAMKILLAQGLRESYTIGHCFRNLEGTGPTHQPEFLMLEWYRTNSNYRQIMIDTEKLLATLAEQITGAKVINYQGKKYDLTHWQTLSVETLWQETFGMSIAAVAAGSGLRMLADARGYNVESSDWEQLFNQLFLNEIEPQLPTGPYFLIDFPARLSPLCQPCADRPWLAERFEAYLGNLELGNGNSEQLDSNAVRQLFTAEIARRQAANEPAPLLDEEMLASLETLAAENPRWAGMGLGVDRVAMALGDLPDIQVWWPKFN